jgi:hypothetical protein
MPSLRHEQTAQGRGPTLKTFFFDLLKPAPFAVKANFAVLDPPVMTAF